MKELRYGDPPALDDCEKHGELKVPATLELSLDPDVQAREEGTIDLIGQRLTPWARVRYAVRILEKKGGKQAAKIPGIGTLVVGEEGWEVL